MLQSGVFHAYECLPEGDILNLVRYCSEVEVITGGYHQSSLPNPNPFVVLLVHPLRWCGPSCTLVMIIATSIASIAQGSTRSRRSCLPSSFMIYLSFFLPVCGSRLHPGDRPNAIVTNTDRKTVTCAVGPLQVAIACCLSAVLCSCLSMLTSSRHIRTLHGSFVVDKWTPSCLLNTVCADYPICLKTYLGVYPLESVNTRTLSPEDDYDVNDTLCHCNGSILGPNPVRVRLYLFRSQVLAR